MEMNGWDHVDHKITREVLSQVSLDDDSICQALSFAMQCNQADQHNEEVSFEILQARCEAYENAELAWNEEGDLNGTVEYLRRFWSV